MKSGRHDEPNFDFTSRRALQYWMPMSLYSNETHFSDTSYGTPMGICKDM